MTNTRSYALLGAVLLASACASGEKPPSGGPGVQQQQPFGLRATSYSALPAWQSTDVSAGFAAFKRQCSVWRNQASTAALGGRYGGQVAFWLPACAAAQNVAPGGERAFFEAFFDPYVVNGAGEAKLTAYYEPVIEVRRASGGPFTAPLLKRPSDMVSVDLRAFADAYDDSALRGERRSLTGQLQGNSVKPYPKRESISPRGDQVIAYAHPADLYNLQVQGSGRIRFEDGMEARAAYAAQNGYKWNSAMQAAPEGQRTWAGLRAYIDASGGGRVLNYDPSYVFFAQETIPDPTIGPRGAANVNLTAQGSVAVDPAYHPYGAVLFVDGTYDGAPFRRVLVAQDTGGAIRRGPSRGDVFFGSGAAAGQAAERMNSPAKFWTLLPKGMPTS